MDNPKKKRKPYIPSPEAAERRRERDRNRSRKKRASEREAKAQKLVLQKSDLPMYKISARRMLPKLPPMTKAELREMLAEAVKNT